MRPGHRTALVLSVAAALLWPAAGTAERITRPTVGSNTCSGITQNTWDFSHLLEPFTG